MTKALISVLVPAFNHERYIEECINSIVNQTYAELELLISDDGSVDSTLMKVKELRKRFTHRFKNIVIDHHSNIGVAESLNLLIKQSSGDYFFIIASDDVIKAHTIERLHSFLSDHKDYVLAVGDNELIDCESNRIYWDRFREPVDKKHSLFQTLGQSIGAQRADKNECFGKYEELLKSNHIPNGYLVRASTIKDIGGYGSLCPEDWNLHLQLSKRGRFKYFNEVLFSYRWHDTNTVRSFKYYVSLRKDRKEQLKRELSWCQTHNILGVWKECWGKEFSLLGTINNIRKGIVQVNFSKGKFIIKVFRKTIFKRG